MGIPTHLPAYFDTLIIPEIFYDAVIERNINKVNNIIKYNPRLCVSIVSYYDITLKSAFFFKKNAKFGIPNKIRWKTKTNSGNIILNFNEQVNLYSYITTAPWKFTNMGFLINAINNYLIQLRYVMGLINRKIPVNNYFNLGVNVHNDAEMKYYIAHFIPGYRWGSQQLVKTV
jgi:PIN domain nuclease of toxin-antitoxin system